ncbi:MAG: Sugar transporter permease [Modestobacter sp.]|jgi:ribose/xylose/arabinose/galactoside ABC-type transport system permease subunit|nr:Sugar transporter permease [Modestobacter sp.]MCW2574174.1 Sugar transporter permease [Modestobacter sp.]MCW2616917.1 Sugar transporter permease [Modestobacter sp.]
MTSLRSTTTSATPVAPTMTPAARGPARPLRSRVLGAVLKNGLLPLLLLAMVTVFAILEPRFLSVDNLTNVGRQSVYLLLITLAQMVLLLCAQLDLSVGATVALTSVVTAMVMSEASGPTPVVILLGVLAGIGIGVLMGLLNAFLVAQLKVPSFMATLGSTSIATGAALMLSKGAPVIGLPLPFLDVFGTGSWLGVPVPVAIAVLFTLVLYGVLYWTSFGRSLFAVGGNQHAAAVAGIRVKAVLVSAFVLCSVLTAIAGVLLTARVASGEATLGSSYVLLSIAAAVLGGTSLFGGEGRLGMVVLGVLFIGILSNGMNLVHVSSYVQQLVIGAVLVLAVAVDRVKATTQ